MKDVHCSSLARLMVCAGPLFFENLPKQETNAAAEEGTAAGEYLERLLTKQQIGTHAKNNVPFDDDMRFYCGDISEQIVANAKTQVLCEQVIDWQTRSGIWIRGRYDGGYISHNDKLYIEDLKYGWGIVEAERNWQLLGYAIGEVIRRGVAFEKIVMRIQQPRPHHEDGPSRAWEITYEELLAYKEQIEARMDVIASGDKTLTTSSHCRYCPASGDACPAIGKAFYLGVEVAHEFLQDSINDKELSQQLDLANRVSEIIKIKMDSLKSLAVSRIKEGKIIPNYVTETSYGDRKWKPGVGPQVFEALVGKKIVEQVMLSPAKAEKAGVPKDLVNALVDRHFLGQKLTRKDSSKIAAKIFGKGE